MAFTRPTLPELVDRIERDLQTRLPLTGPVLRRSVVAVVARVLAGAVHGLYGFLTFLAAQLFPDTSTSGYLERQASVFGITRLPASYATGRATVGGVNGTVIPARSLLQRADGLTYLTGDDQTISSGTATVNLTAQTAGEAGNLAVSSILTFVSPVAGANPTGTVATGGLTGGADQEADAGLRTRLLARLQTPPQGGSAADYLAWALSVAGVTRAWVSPEETGAGTVVLRLVRDNDGTGGAIIPGSGAVAAVQAVLDALRPVTASETVVAPVADTTNFTVSVSPNTTDVHAAVIAELTDLIQRAGAPGATLLLSSIRTAIGVTSGLTDFSLTVPSADVTHAAGHIPIMGTVTFV